MRDTIQRTLVGLTTRNGAAWLVLVFSAAILVYLLGLAGRVCPGHTRLVLLGRLGVGAHHTLDVAGRLGIVAVAAPVVGAMPLPTSWRVPLSPRRGGRRAAVPGAPRSDAWAMDRSLMRRPTLSGGVDVAPANRTDESPML